MKVKDLIKRLKKFKPDTEIVVSTDEPLVYSPFVTFKKEKVKQAKESDFVRYVDVQSAVKYKTVGEVKKVTHMY